MSVPKSNRAAALRWLAAHAGQTLDTLAYENGELCWTPGPRRLDNVRSGSASGWVMVRPSEKGGSYISTDPGSRFYVNGDTLVIQSMVHLVSGPDGSHETWRETHYSVATAEPFVAQNIVDIAAASDGRVVIIPVKF